MMLILSPSKALDMDVSPTVPHTTIPALLDQAEPLVEILRQYEAEDLQHLMYISAKLAQLNAQRYQQFTTPFTTDNAAPALFAFQGDVYDGLNAPSLSQNDLEWAQAHLRILSGLYGLLRPLDLMQAYRLEMGTKLANPQGKNLYEYWGAQLAEQLNHAAQQAGTHTLLNLASQEYAKAVPAKALTIPMVTITFKEKRGDSVKTIGLMAKKARGRMAGWIIQNRLDKVDALMSYELDGYHYHPELSSEQEIVFIR